MLRRALFYLVAFICALVGGCTMYFQAYDKIVYAGLRASESAQAAEEARSLGLEAEEKLKRTGTLPTSRELNCWREPCDSIFFVTREVTVDKNGIIHAKVHKLGVPFTPTSQFTANWNSADRTTDRDLLANSWMWRLLFLPWLVASALVALAPWLPRLMRSFLQRRARRKSSEAECQ